MNDRGGSSFLDRYTGRSADSREHLDPPLDGEVEGLSFSVLRGIRDRASWLELHKRDGTMLAIPYHSIERMLFDPSDGITILVGARGQRIQIRGRHLNAKTKSNLHLFNALARQRAQWIKECDRATSMEIGEDSPVIEEISW